MSRNRNRISWEHAQVLIARRKQAPRGYCRRCWRHGDVTVATRRGTRCDVHDAQIKAEVQENDLRAQLKEDAEIDMHERIWTALKWVARQTGAGYRSSPDALNAVVFDAFWEAMPDTRSVGQSRIDVAYDAAIAAYEKHARTKVAPIACLECGDQGAYNRRNNDFTCRNCGWKAEPGSFGAIYLLNETKSLKPRCR